jgi:hypothetical protein
MKIKLVKSFGQIEIDTADDKDAIAQASFWSELPDLCPLCGETLYLHYRVTKEGDYKYYELYCRGEPKHFTQFGQYKSGGLFYKAGSWAEHTFNSVQSERDSEINGFDEERGQLIGRIKKANEAIKSLGGKVEAFDFSKAGLDELRAEIDALTEQYNRLKKSSAQRA